MDRAGSQGGSGLRGLKRLKTAGLLLGGAMSLPG